MTHSALKTLSFAAAVCGVLAACSSASVIVPSATIEAPDVPGVTRVNFGANVNPGRRVHFSDDVSARPPDITGNADNSSSVIATGDAGIGLGHRFEVSANIGGANSQNGCGGVMGKFQIVGEPNATAKAGDVPVAVFAHMEDCVNSMDGDHDGAFGPAGYPWRADFDSFLMDIGLSAGIRPTAHTMIYAGGSVGGARAHVKIHQVAAGANPSDEDYSDHHGALETAGSIGFKMNWKQIWFNLTGSFTHAGFAGANPDQIVGQANFTFQL